MGLITVTMQLTKFLDGYPRVLFSADQDGIFSTLRIMTHGMCSVRLAKLLNFASRFLEGRECYLEIGTYGGFTLLSAGYESFQTFIGVDDFSENYSIRGDVKKELTRMLETYPGYYFLVESDFKKVDLKDVLQDGAKIGVFLIDGKHTYDEVMASMAWARPYLSENALVCFDDVNVPGVAQAMEEIRKDPAFEQFFFVKSFFENYEEKQMKTDPFVHNGFGLMSYVSGRLSC